MVYFFQMIQFLSFDALKPSVIDRPQRLCNVLFIHIYLGHALHNCGSETFYIMTRPKAFINNNLIHSEGLYWQLAVIALHNRFSGAYKVTMKSTKRTWAAWHILTEASKFHRQENMGETAHDPNLSQWIIYFQTSWFSAAEIKG